MKRVHQGLHGSHEEKYKLKLLPSIPKTESAIDRQLEWAPLAIALGFLGAIVCRWIGVPGVLTAFALMMCGAAGGSLERYKAERGLWMLVGLFGLFLLTLWTVFVVMTVRDAMRGSSSVGWVAIDAGIATVVYGLTWRLLLGIAYINYYRFRGVRHAH